MAGARVPDLLSADEWARLVRSLELTPREAEVLRAAFYVASRGAIARRVGISEDTVHGHCRHIFGKLRVGSIAQAISVALAAHLELSARIGAEAECARPVDPRSSIVGVPPPLTQPG